VSRLEDKFCIPSDRRAAARRRIFITGSAVTIRGSKSVIVENVSTTGARVCGRDLPPIGKQVLIWMEGLDVLGSVAWVKNDECGVRFDLSLEAKALTCLEEQAVGTVYGF
jgi:hypothetical protein